MAFRLSEAIQARIDELRKAEGDARFIFANLSDDDLAASASFWLEHCDAPKRIEPGSPVYDSTFWHAIVPEMIRRLKERGF